MKYPILSFIGAQRVRHAAPDGYTILMHSGVAYTVNPALYANAGYDPLKDFVPLIPLTTRPDRGFLPGVCWTLS